jgi:phosphoglycerate dehydrogenase-like enzyme
MNFVSVAPLKPDQTERLRGLVPAIEIRQAEKFNDAEFDELLDDSTEVVYSFRVPKNIMELAPNLKWLQLLGAGCDHLQGNPLVDSGVLVSTASGVHATPIAEYVLAVILGFYRGLPKSYRAQYEKVWIPQGEHVLTSREFRRRTVGIIGYGSIGREVARLAKPFGVKILAVKRDPSQLAEDGYSEPHLGDPDGSLPDTVYGIDDLEEVLSQADVVVLAMPSTVESKGMFGVKQFAAMKEGSYIVNIARGHVIDDDALIDALNNGPVLGAALDVFNQEPLPTDHPYWSMEQVILTSHLSGASRPHLRRVFEILCENIPRYLNDEKLLNQVDWSRGY